MPISSSKATLQTKTASHSKVLSVLQWDASFSMKTTRKKEEFRQLLRSYQRFYAFVAQVVSLNDPWLEKLYAYTSWLVAAIAVEECACRDHDHRRYAQTIGI